jgi:zinc protease
MMYSCLRKTVLVLTAAAMALTLASCGGKEAPRMVVVEKQELPVVYFRVMVSAGSAYDPDSTPGLAYFTAHLLNKGTQSYSREDIENKLDDIGGQIGISVDKEVVVITGKTLKENLEAFYPIFKEIVTEPTFPKAEVDQQKNSQLDRINQIREDDRALSLAVFENTLFDGHRYGHLVEGTESAISTFTKEDAASFFKTHYVQGNVIAGIAGAVDDSLAFRFESDLKLLPKGSVVLVSSPPTPITGRKVVLVEKENRTQSQLRIGHLIDITRRSLDFYPLRIDGSYLGEHREMFGQLAQEIRVKRGLAYGAYAYTQYFRQAGWSKLEDNGICRNYQYFHMWTYPKEVNFDFCIKLMLAEMSKLAAGQITQSDLDLVKDYVANNFPFLIETPDMQLGMKLDDIWYSTPDFIDNFQQRIRSVDLDGAKEVAEAYFHPDDVLIVAVVSNGAKAEEELLSLSTPLELPSGAEEGDLRAADDEIKDTPLGVQESDITIVRAADLFK